MKRKIILVIASILLVAATTLSACNKPVGPQDSSDGGSSSVSSGGNNSTGGVGEGETYGDINEKLAAFSDFCELESGYTAIDLKEGFPEVTQRVGDGFEDYPVGYGEKTTGGRGATAENIYNVNSGLEFEQAVSAISEKLKTDGDLKSIVMVNGNVTLENTSTYQIIVNGVKNLSVIGNGGEFDGVGLNFKSSRNVIVQNLKIHHPSKALKNEKDCLEFNDCKYVWVDHCEFFNDYPANSAEKDYYDGLVDVKNESEFVTISYNYLHDAFKTSLVGSGPGDLYENRTVTYHHNVIENCNSRLPLYRGGYAHVYNNYYKNALSRCVETRFGAKVFVESNYFENAKNPVCSIEEEIGYYNVKNNKYVNCTASSGTASRPAWSENMQSTTDYTPSYRYTLDGTDNLIDYLNKTVGIGKIDIEKAKAEPADKPRDYVIPEYKIVKKAIDSLEKITLDSDVQKKLTYIAKKYTLLSEADKQKIENIGSYEKACDEFLKIYVEDIVANIAKIDINGDFTANAKTTYQVETSYLKMKSLIENRVGNYSDFIRARDYYNADFKNLFNAEVLKLSDAKPADKAVIDDLYYLYEIKSNSVSGLDKANLDKAAKVCDDKTKIGAFSESLKVFDGITELNVSHALSVKALIKTYDELSAEQKGYISQTDLDKYNEITKKYDALSDKNMAMDLTSVPTGRTSGVVNAGDIRLGTSTDVRATAENYQGENYDKAVFLSGYGNAGSKCLQLSVLKNSTVELVVKVESDACNLLLTDENKVVKQSQIVSFDGLVKITFSSVGEGEYRIFTDIPSNQPDASFTGSKIFIYSVNIIPTN
ncbi:MAG: polysaccharide lyase family 1 protein [Christensenellaceae bacterium]